MPFDSISYTLAKRASSKAEKALSAVDEKVTGEEPGLREEHGFIDTDAVDGTQSFITAFSVAPVVVAGNVFTDSTDSCAVSNVTTTSFDWHVYTSARDIYWLAIGVE